MIMLCWHITRATCV